MRKIYNIKLFRRDFAIKQQELAAILNCSQSYVSYLERGERGMLPAEEKILFDRYGEDTMKKYLLVIDDLDENGNIDVKDTLIESLTKTIESQQATIEKQQSTITHLLNIIEKSHD